jgi:spore maturation protein CgeB
MRPKLLNIHMGEHNPVFLEALSNVFECTHVDWVLYGRNSTELQRLIIHNVEELRPDYVFLHIQDGDVVTIDTIKNISQKAKVINWTGDVRHPIPEHYLLIGREIFLTLFSNLSDVETARAKGINADFLQVGFDDTKFTPAGPVNKNYQPILFLGSDYTNSINFPLSKLRLEMVNVLKKEFGQYFGIYGTGWKEANGIITSYEEEAIAYRSCKIAINLSHFSYKKYSSDRLFRILGSGTFCLTHHYPLIEEDFADGRHLVVWRDFYQLIDQIYFYLNHEEDRNEIALRGCAKAHYKFTWHNFSENLLTLIQKHNNKKQHGK